MSRARLDPKRKEEARLRYVARNVPLQTIAQELDVDLETLRAVAERERWDEQREEYWRSVYTDIIHTTRTQTAGLMTKTVAAADRLVGWALDEMVVDKRTKRVFIEPGEVGAITQAIKTGLEVLKFALGEPDALVISGRVEMEERQHIFEEAARDLKRLIEEKKTG